jgi:hypothetical protein
MPRSSGMSLLVALALGFTTGCIYITPGEFIDKKNSLDEDDDGVTLGEDCDDKDGARFPGNPEVAYDGIDQDCDELKQDLLDKDGDKYPGISRAEYEAQHPDAPDWPEGIIDEIDGVQMVDCDDDDKAVYPGATDSWYDGTDSDCAGNDDYDQDGDESVPDAYADVSIWDGGDCDDTKDTVGPHVTTDAWYDGIDSDCLRNNDFDQDGDQYMPNAVSGVPDMEKAYTDYIEFYGYSYAVMYADPIGAGPYWDDCVDADDLTHTPNIVAAEIYPGAADDWYDGIDSDCDAINDFDQDADGYIRTEDIAAYDTFEDYWGYTFGAGTNDCDDLDSAVHPATVEGLSDAIDQDCDGGVDTTPWSDGGYDWDEVRPVVVGKNDLHYILTTAATATSATAFEKPGVSLVFPLDPGFDEMAESVVVWQNTGTSRNPIGDTVEMVTGTDDFYIGSQYFLDSTTGSDGIYLIGKWVEWSTVSSSYGSKLAYNTINVGSTGEQFYNDVDIQKDSTDKWWVLGCGDQSVNVMRVDPFYASSPWKKDGLACDADSVSCAQYTGMSGDSCWLEISGTSAQAVVCTGSDCTTYDVDPLAETLTASATQMYDGKTWTSVNRSGDWLVAVQTDGTVYLSDYASSYTVFDTSYDATYADVAEAPDGTVYIAAVVADETSDGFEDVLLAYGTPGGTMSYVVLPMSDEAGNTWHAEYASVHADDGYVMIGATGYYDGSCSSGSNCDEVAWIFFTPPA